MKKDEAQMVFFRSIHDKRMMLAIIEAVPSAIAWTLTTILLVNVSNV